METASVRYDQTSAGYDNPATVLLADRIDTAEPRHRIAGVNLVDAASAFYQSIAIHHVVQHPALDCGQTRDARLGHR